MTQARNAVGRGNAVSQSHDPDVLRERERCLLIVKALVDSIAEPTGLSIVITAEKMFDGRASSAAARVEWQRCIGIMDVAGKRARASRPACWAYDAIASGLPLADAIHKVFVTPAYSGPCVTADQVTLEELSVVEGGRAPVRADIALTVEEVGSRVVLDGIPEVYVDLDPEAAIETGIELINTGLRIEEKLGTDCKK